MRLYLMLFFGNMADKDPAAQPLQAYLMAQVITVFQYTTDEALTAGASYWSLRFVYLAIGVGVGYAIIGWASHSFSVVNYIIYHVF